MKTLCRPISHTRLLILSAVSLCAVCASLPAAAAGKNPAPRRIVSLAPGITEILFALGLGPRVVGDTTYCDYPPAAKAKTHIGDSTTDYEAVIALHPDLIIADETANRQAITQLTNLQQPLFLIKPTSLAATESCILAIGKRTGEAKTAKVVVDRMRVKESLAGAMARAHANEPLRTLAVVGLDPLYVAGPGSFVGDMIAEGGAKNVITEMGFAAYSKEAAVASDPQVIFCDGDDVAGLKSDPAWNSTSAGRLGNIFPLDSGTTERPGPRLADGLVTIAHDLTRAKR